MTVVLSPTAVIRRNKIENKVRSDFSPKEESDHWSKEEGQERKGRKKKEKGDIARRTGTVAWNGGRVAPASSYLFSLCRKNARFVSPFSIFLSSLFPLSLPFVSFVTKHSLSHDSFLCPLKLLHAMLPSRRNAEAWQQGGIDESTKIDNENNAYFVVVYER